ncbi:MAG TPA: hypothetical protein VHN14_13290 [Kofleriaceae bacterium]|jgi:hypothetical protein|nr:hypothetical protein [Kofleriaceae bacterium]
MLRGRRHARAGGERRDRGQLDRLELGRRCEQVTIDRDADPLVDRRRPAERVALVLREHVGGRTRVRSALHYFEQDGRQLGARQLGRQVLEG